jgi:hypothetical protein
MRLAFPGPLGKGNVEAVFERQPGKGVVVDGIFPGRAATILTFSTMV